MILNEKTTINTPEVNDLDEILGDKISSDESIAEITTKKKRSTTLNLPCKIGQRVDYESGFKWLEDLKDEEQKQIRIYLYRILPVIKKEPAYIDKFELDDVKQFNLNYIKTSHGGGSYDVSINGLGDGKRLFIFSVNFDQAIYSPQIIIKELDTNSAKNERFIGDKIRRGDWKFENGILVEVEKGKEQMTQVVQPTIDHVAIMEANNKMIREMVQTLKPPPAIPPVKEDNSMIIAMLSSQQESAKLMLSQMQANSDNQMKMFMTMISEMNKKPEPLPKDDTMIKFIMEELKTTKEQSTKLMEVLMNQKPTDPMKQMLSTMEFIEKIKGNSTGTEDEKKDWKERALDMALEHGPTLLSMIGGGLNAQRAGLPPEVGIANPNPGPVGYNASNPMPQQPRPTPQQPTQVQNPSNDLEILLSNPAAMAVVAQKINEDMRGWEFGGLLVDMFGRPAYNQISNLGESVIFETINKNTTLRNAISTFSDEKLKIWVKEFVNMDSEIKEQQVEPETIN